MKKETAVAIPKKNVTKKSGKTDEVKASKAEKVNTPAEKVAKKKSADPKKSDEPRKTDAMVAVSEWRSPVEHARSSSRKKIKGRLS